MDSWFGYLKRGLKRKRSSDHLLEGRTAGDWRSNLRNLLPFIKCHWKKGVLGALLILLASLIAFPQPLIYRFLVDTVILEKQLSLLLWVVLLMVGMKAADKGMGVLQQFYFTRFEQRILLDIQKDLFEHTLRLPKSFFDQQEIGYIMSRLSSDVSGLQWFFSSTLVYILSQSIRLIGGVVFLLVLEWRLAIAILLSVPFLILGVRFFARKTHTLSLESMEQHAHVSREMQESLSSASLIKAFSSEKSTVKRLTNKIKAAQQLVLERSTVNSFASVVISFLPELASAVVLVVGAVLIIQDQWSLGSLLAFQSYMGYVFGPAQYLAFANLDLHNALAALERVSALYDIVPEDSSKGAALKRLKGEVEFNKVTFSYDQHEPVLQDVSFHVSAGEHVAIVGPSGVGKTTLISLLLRFYQPSEGEICFDGQPASTYRLNDLRKRVGYVAQSTSLLSGTIMDNLRYGNPRAKQAQVIRAAKVAGIHDFIAGLAKGYSSRVGERGVNFSEGQKQRLSIARALIKDPDILILDEPTSALDSLLERSIFDALPSMVRSKTLFVIAHRLATVQHSDRILLLNENRLIAVGTHQALLKSNDFYRSMVENQQILAA